MGVNVDMSKVTPVMLDLPLNEVVGYLEGLLLAQGDDVTVDGVRTKIMISDLLKTYSNLQENCKQGVFSKLINLKRGSTVDFDDGRKGIVYTIPNDDIVSYSARVLMCNAEVELYKDNEEYDEETGDIISQNNNEKGKVMCFVERLTAREKRYDFGLLHEAVLRIVTYAGANIALGDTVMFHKRKYEVIDIDDITEGIIVVQLTGVKY